MKPLLLSSSVPLILMLAAAAFGMLIRTELKDHHKSVETTDLLRVTVTMLVTFAAIVLGLLITSSKTSFDTADAAMHNYAATLSELDESLRADGTNAAPLRQELTQYMAAAIASTWASEKPPAGNYYPRNVGNSDNGIAYESAKLGNLLQQIGAGISGLNCQTADQVQARKASEAAMTEVLRQRWVTIAASQVSLSTPFFIVLVFWLVIVFLCLGLSTPWNALSGITIVLSAIALASALFVVADLNGLYSGIFSISSAPMRGVLAQMLTTPP